ncbi:MAG: YgiT-type zinc finger protein [Desulfobacteraceae bacterium]|nr:YgiT-type zinc finger protein [Desulfobacteraceae bacterium]
MKEKAVCKACRAGRLYRREVTQKFEREGLEVSIDGIPALVCEKCSQIYYLPGTGDRISAAADHLFMLSAIKHVGEYRAAV